MESIKTIDKIEVVGEYKHIQVRERIDIVEDDNVMASSYRRWVIAPNQDHSQESADVQAMCKQFHTQEIIDAYNQHLESLTEE
jgi:hypothetical protein